MIEKEKAIFYGYWGNRYYRTKSDKVFVLESGYGQGCYYHSPSGKTYYLNRKQTKKLKERIEFIEF